MIEASPSDFKCPLKNKGNDVSFRNSTKRVGQYVLLADTGLLSERRRDSSSEVSLGRESSDRPLAGENVSIEEGSGLLKELGRVLSESERLEETCKQKPSEMETKVENGSSTYQC